ncbi:MAG: hypothetical protein RMM98_05645 [Acidobacteriota bacterium]|nr:hypothetical protein [Blastocatellia bacterium]MDW8239079.1 hypothetical protein [Acidobacteriota bacterium]
MKYLVTLGLVFPSVVLGFANTLLPYVGIIVLIVMGGPAALFVGAGAYLFQFVYGYLVQSGLSPFELFLGL